MFSFEIDQKLQNMQGLYGKKLEQMYLEFLRYMVKKYPGCIISLKQYLMSQKKDQFLLLEEMLEKYPPSAILKYFAILNKHHYRIQDKIVDSICLLAESNQPDQDMESVSKKPWILNVSNQSNGYSVDTSFGDFSFYPVKDIYGSALEKIQSMFSGYDDVVMENGYNPYAAGNLNYMCHFATEQFSLMYPDVYAVTSLCPHKFSNYYWMHSYNLFSNGNLVIDIANGFLMDRYSYEKLMEPIVLSQVLGSEMEHEIELVKQTQFAPYLEILESCPLKGIMVYHLDRLSKEEQNQIRKKIS